MKIQSPTHQEMSNLISHSLKLLLTSLTKTTSKTSKLIFINLKYFLKSTKSLSQKTIQKILRHRRHHHTVATALNCRPYNAENYLSTFISPRDYQFSCSSSPIILRKSKHRSHNYKYNIYHQKHSNRYYNNVSAVDQVLNILNRGNYDHDDFLPEMELPGFEKSPVIARQLRVTDSPFSLREGICGGDERSGEVDKAAEEFIDRFYNELKLQRNLVSVPAAVHGGRVDNRYNRTRWT